MLKKAPRVFMIGILGSGMRGLAYLLQTQGQTVVGSDQSVTTNTTSPEGYTLFPEEKAPQEIKAGDLVIYSDAVPGTHPTRQAAEAAGLIVLSYQEALGQFSQDYTTLAVTGTHGKSSTTAFVAHILTEAGLDPTVLVGASVPAWGGQNARLGKSQYLVVEADEYREHFLTLSPAYIVITSIDFDHPDYFSSLSHVQAAYTRFIARLPDEGRVLALASTVAAAHEVEWRDKLISISDEAAASLPAPLPGEHMQRNALLAVSLAEHLGVDRSQAVASLRTFSGLSRRMEQIGAIGSVPVFSDYGHHPQEISATLTAVRQKYQKIGVLLEPHMIERLTTYYEGFVQAFEPGDVVVICPVFYPKGRAGETSDLPAKFHEALQKRGIISIFLQDFSPLEVTLQQLASSREVIVAFTAGVLDGKLRALL